MHILLTDVLTCPRCGPAFGLILLADRIVERRVRDGALGCSNCRERYLIRDGIPMFADSPAAPDPMPAADAEAALRAAALLGVTQGPAWILVAGPATGLAGGIADVLHDIEVIAAVRAARADVAGTGPSRVNTIQVADRLPLASHRMAGVLLGGAAAGTLLEEAARVLAPLGRLVLEGAPPDAEARIEAAGLRVLVRDDDTMIAIDRRVGRRT
ncbi:MAG TPA: Trm112 family protein [Longimicrobiales bacterium]|nr:Trm112 family protein [Longimicrobiales bacterium]